MQTRYLPCLVLARQIVMSLTTASPTTFPITTPRTTTPPTTFPRDGCMYEGRFYPNGADIERDSNNCFGMICENGNTIAWDDKCFLEPPTCPGSSERKDGQCCPICHTTKTTVPTTTTLVPENGCIVNGVVYQNYDRFNMSSDHCTGNECHYGTIRKWNERCPSVDSCSGTVISRDSGCCKEVCVPFNNDCEIRGKTFKTGDITNEDPCTVCECGGSGQEKCTSYSCNNCKQSPKAECCQQTCGAASNVFGIMSYCVVILGLKSWW